MTATQDAVGAAQMHGWDVKPIAAKVGVAVRGIDLRAVTPLEVEALHALLAGHGVVIFPEQHVAPDEHLALGHALGTIKPPPEYFPEKLAAHPEIGVISTENGLAYTSDRWHADVTWMAAPPRYSILSMEQPAPSGGDTMWASQIEAFEWLSPPMQELLTGLTVEHALPSRDDELHSVHPLVIRHPLTGRRALFVNSVFSKQIVELREDESAAVLRFLFEHSTRPELVCRWTWTKGDVAIWDNHFVQHYAVGDYHPAPRRIHRIEIEGDRPIPAIS